MSKRRSTRDRNPGLRPTPDRLASASPRVALWRIVAFGVAAAVWIALYLATPLPALGPRTLSGDPWRRWDLLLHYLLLPDELVTQWLGAPPDFALLDRVPVILGAAATLGLAGLTGWLLMRLIGACAGLTRLEVCVFSFGVGLSAVSLYTLAVGLAGQLRQPAFFLAPVVAVIAISATIWRVQSRCEPDAADLPKQPTDETGLSLHWLWLAAPMVAVVCLGGMLPPADFDVREYHLQAPKEFYQLGRIAFLSHNVYANMPLGAELLSLPAMSVCGDWWLGALIGKTVIAAYLPLTALALFAAGRRLVSTSAGIVAALAYLSVPGLTVVSVSGLIEGALAFYLLLAVYAVVLSWRSVQLIGFQATGRLSPTTARLLLAGFLAGAAGACKYPGLVFVVLPLAGFLVGIWQRRYSVAPSPAPISIQDTARLKETAVAGPIEIPPQAGHSPPKAIVQSQSRFFLFGPKGAAIFLLAAAVACGPWLLKNAFLTGNPVYPLAYGLLDGVTRTPDKNTQWLKAHSPPNYRPQDLLGRLADVLLRSDAVSPILVPLAVLALFGRRHRRFAFVLAAYGAFIFTAWWLLTHRIERFFLPALPLAALLAGIGAANLLSHGWRKGLVGLLVFGLVVNLLFTASPEGYANAPGSPIAFVRYFVDLDRLRNSPERIDAWHVYLNQQARPEDAVLLVGDAAVFDLRMPVEYNTVFDSCVFEQLANGRTSQQFQATLLERGITHIYVDWSEIRRYRSTGNYGFTPFVQPEVFQKLVADEVLDPPLPTSELVRAGILAEPESGRIEHPGELYRVRGQRSEVRGQTLPQRLTPNNPQSAIRNPKSAIPYIPSSNRLNNSTPVSVTR